MWRDTDLDALVALLDGDPEVRLYIGDGSPLTHHQVTGAPARLREGWQERGSGCSRSTSRMRPECRATAPHSRQRVRVMRITREEYTSAGGRPQKTRCPSR
ncbi:hypothetical protein AQJ84_31860 [Streptomyces resistomycificus]|uniref:Uncharacterized protein n=1 Tax=Streptomyces resistomycificus TaxID=67356 RepID=A0A0L8LWJ0_9ACTN|nr:hypothetical protein ADK37_04755 [Streptomyces resistomycificus]KUN92591.1 hypothetical protein AQJ84_31860 [Streptomyces resistomycificus]